MKKCTTRKVRVGKKPGPKHVRVKSHKRSTHGKPC